MSPGDDLLALVVEQRARLGQMVAGMDEREWNVPSLCRGWRVRDVVAHCIQNHRATPWRLVGQMVAAGFSLDERNRRWVARCARMPPRDLIAEYRASAGRIGFPRFEAGYALVEDVVHGYDIARPLGRLMDVPVAGQIAVAETCRRAGPMIGGRRRTAGLTLCATDLAWRIGAGPEVRGPMASIVLAIAGRGHALDDLAGPGLTVLRSRLDR